MKLLPGAARLILTRICPRSTKSGGRWFSHPPLPLNFLHPHAHGQRTCRFWSINGRFLKPSQLEADNGQYAVAWGESS